MKDVLIRNWQPDEWMAYKSIRLRALQDSPDAFGSTYSESAMRPDDYWIDRLGSVKPDNDHPLVAQLGEKPVGLAWAKIEPDDTSDAAHLYQMWVDPEHRGKQIGRQLVLAAITWAKSLGATRMVLDVTSGDRPARRLYDSMGFEPVGGLIPLREGSDLLEQTMALKLV